MFLLLNNYKLYSSCNIGGKVRRKETTGKTKTYVDNIKIDLREIGRNGVDWIAMAQDRDKWRTLVNTALNLWVP
jgi:hypothetical protein